MIMCGRNSDAHVLFERFVRDEDGATAIEYGLIVSLIFIAILTAVNNFTAENRNIYAKIENAVHVNP